MKRSFPWVALLACGGAEPAAQVPQAPQARPIAAAPSSLPPVVSTPTAPPIAVVELPSALNGPTLAACIYTSDMQGTLPLRLSAAGDSFAFIKDGLAVKVSLPVGPLAEGAWVETDIGPAVIRGRVPDWAIDLYPQVPTVVKGFLIPSAERPVKASKADIDAITFAPDFNTSLVATVDKDLSESRPCGFFALKPKSFLAIKATGSESRGSAALRPGKHELRKELNGGVMATLMVTEPAYAAEVLATSGSQKRIAWDVDGALVFGWVSARAVVENQLAGGYKSSDKGVLATRVSPLPWTRVKCNEELPLVAEVGTERAVVGVIKKERFFQIGPNQNGWRGVAFPDSPVRDGDKGRLVVPSMKTVGCAG